MVSGSKEAAAGISRSRRGNKTREAPCTLQADLPGESKLCLSENSEYMVPAFANNGCTAVQQWRSARTGKRLPVGPGLPRMSPQWHHGAPGGSGTSKGLENPDRHTNIGALCTTTKIGELDANGIVRLSAHACVRIYAGGGVLVFSRRARHLLPVLMRVTLLSRYTLRCTYVKSTHVCFPLDFRHVFVLCTHRRATQSAEKAVSADR